MPLENGISNVRYDPKYKFCRDRLKEEHDELFTIQN